MNCKVKQKGGGEREARGRRKIQEQSFNRSIPHTPDPSQNLGWANYFPAVLSQGPFALLLH